jgi:predicted transcriptional regulator
MSIFVDRPPLPEPRDERWLDLSANQYKAMRLLDQCAEYGVTSAELSVALHTHHGTASGCLSHLHERGLITRLADQRNSWGSNGGIYVLPEYTLGRATKKHASTKRKKKLVGAFALTFCPQCGYISPEIPPPPPPPPPPVRVSASKKDTGFQTFEWRTN